MGEFADDCLDREIDDMIDMIENTEEYYWMDVEEAALGYEELINLLRLGL